MALSKEQRIALDRETVESVPAKLRYARPGSGAVAPGLCDGLVCRSDAEDQQKAALEELRFAKTRMTQFGVGALGLVGAIFTAVQGFKLNSVEKIALIGLFALIASVGSALLYKQHRHVKNTRLVFDSADDGAWSRGADVVRDRVVRLTSGSELSLVAPPSKTFTAGIRQRHSASD
jgi:hypothetical protein